MAALDQVTGTKAVALSEASGLFKAVIWSWFRAHQDDVIFTKWGFLRITVGMCRPIIVAIAGEEPQ